MANLSVTGDLFENSKGLLKGCDWSAAQSPTVYKGDTVAPSSSATDVTVSTGVNAQSLSGNITSVHFQQYIVGEDTPNQNMWCLVNWQVQNDVIYAHLVRPHAGISYVVDFYVTTTDFSLDFTPFSGS